MPQFDTAAVGRIILVRCLAIYGLFMALKTLERVDNATSHVELSSDLSKDVAEWFTDMFIRKH